MSQQAIDNFQTRKAYDSQAALGGWEEEEETDAKVDPEAEARFRRVEDWWIQERQAQANNRFLMARDQDFIDGDQWSQADKEELESRGQPAMVYNLMGTTIRWITGVEKRTRVDYKVIGRGEEDLTSAENKTALLKYLSDVNKSGYHASKAFEDAVGAGVGWVEVGVRSDKGKEPLFERYENWRNIWFDRMSVDPAMEDGRYLFRGKWLDLDVAQAYFPEHKGSLELAAEDHEFFFADDEFWDVTLEEGHQTVATTAQVANATGRRQRVRLVECWYKEPQRCKVMKGTGPFNGAIVDEADPRLMFLANEAEVYPAIRQVMRVMIFVSGRTSDTGQMLYDGRSPYWHNRFPFVPTWGYRKKRDNMPYGAARNLIDPQTDLNKRRSKALHILSTNQVIMDKGAVDDLNVLADEISRPDTIIEKNPGKSLEINRDKQLAQQHINLMEQDAQYIQKVGGVTDENLGRQTNATSGKAIEARQDQGTTVNSDLFDNHRLAMQLRGELKLSLIEQYYDEQKILRLIGEKGKVEFKEINADHESSIINAQADFVVDEQAFNQSIRRAMFEELFGLVSKLPPEMSIKLLDVVVDMSDYPMREELVARIRQINGMRGADEEPSPEEQQAMAADQEKKQRLDEATLLMAEGKALLTQSQGSKEQMAAIQQKIQAMLKAMEVAGILRANPMIGSGADEVMAAASK